MRIISDNTGRLPTLPPEGVGVVAMRFPGIK
jgi:hypothetical protein